MAQSFHGSRARRCYRCGWYGHIARFCQYAQSSPPPPQPLPEHWPTDTKIGSYLQGRRPPPLWLPQHQRTFNGEQLNPYTFPATPISPYWSRSEALYGTHFSQTSAYDQAHPLEGLPTPSSLALSLTTSPVSPTGEHHFEGLPFSTPYQDWNADANDANDINLQALDFPVSCTPAGVLTCPILRTAEPLPASMEIPGALGALRRADFLLPGTSVSKHFQSLNVDVYYQNICEKSGWEDVCHDPAFSFVDTLSHAVSFADLDACRASTLENFEDEELNTVSKFDVSCLHQDSANNVDEGRLAEDQEAILVRLGVSGTAKPAYSGSSHAAMHLPTLSTQGIPPWRRNGDSRYSRIFPGPSKAYHQSGSNSGQCNMQPSYDKPNAFPIASEDTDLSTLDMKSAPEQKPSSLSRDPINRKRSRATNTPDATGEVDMGKLGAKTRKVSYQSTASTSPGLYRRISASEHNLGNTQDDPDTDPVDY